MITLKDYKTKKVRQMNETELYEPVKALFEDLGYTVTSEVNHIDIVAEKEDELTIIELKTAYNLKLILQAVKRQQLTDTVYIAIPMPKFTKRYHKDFKDKELLLRRLEIGLIFVSFTAKNPYAQIVFPPKPFNKNMSQGKSKRRKALLDEELARRHGDNNIGGTRGKIITAYKETAILIAYYLSINEELSVKALKELTQNDKTPTFLTNNHYGWYDHVRRGYYCLSKKGKDELSQYQAIIEKLI
jgi:hypothetical protein